MSESVPEQMSDDTDLGWGEPPPEEDEDDLRRFVEDRPPHFRDV